MDELIPPLVRNWKVFMYPLYYVWFKGDLRNVKTVMNYKKDVFSMSSLEIRDLYKHYQNIGSSRATDAFEEDYRWIRDRIEASSFSLIDIGCGKGFWINELASSPNLKAIKLFALDVMEASMFGEDVEYSCGEIETLPFKDKSFDIVTCLFVLEHIKDFNRALGELKRIARRQLFLAVPCQRYNKYTFDLHVHFFYSPEYFRSMIGLLNSECHLNGIGDTGHIVYCANME
jgi:SAM-dependent methyltransferase